MYTKLIMSSNRTNRAGVLGNVCIRLEVESIRRQDKPDEIFQKMDREPPVKFASGHGSTCPWGVWKRSPNTY